MQAIVVHEFGGPEVLKLEERPDPAPGQSQVLVDVRAVGVNPVDTYVRTGTYAVVPPLPYTPGSDGAGVVAAVGGLVRALAPGDRVYFSGTAAGRSMGAYASKAVCDTSQITGCPSACRSRKAPPWACRTPRRTGRSSRAPRPGPARPCWSTAPAAASAWPPSRSRARSA